MRGELVDMLLFDLGGEVPLADVATLLGQAPVVDPLVSRLPAPPSLALPAPLRIELADDAPGPADGRVELRLHAIGVLTVRMRRRFDAPVEDLPAYGASLVQQHRADMRDLADRAIGELRPHLVETYEATVAAETYTTYVLHQGPVAEDVLAGLVLGEPRWQTLAPAMIEDALARTLQYTRDDLVVIGWDNAVIVSSPGDHEDLIDVMELANLELLELRVLDAILDRRLDRSLSRLEKLWRPSGLFRSARLLLADLAGLRADFVRIRDSVQDTGKIFGDWYLAKVHRRLRERFHLAEWEKAVAAKMDSLEDMFQVASEETNHRRALILESMIVFLFILDIIILFSLEF